MKADITHRKIERQISNRVNRKIPHYIENGDYKVQILLTFV